MAPSQEARKLAPAHMFPQDIENYQDFFRELMDTGGIPKNAVIQNIHQIFDADWGYQGAWYTAATESRPTQVFWVWVDSEWENMRVSAESPLPMYTWIGFLTELKVLYYRAYGNCGDWWLMSAGTINIERFC